MYSLTPYLDNSAEVVPKSTMYHLDSYHPPDKDNSGAILDQQVMGKSTTRAPDGVMASTAGDPTVSVIARQIALIDQLSSFIARLTEKKELTKKQKESAEKQKEVPKKEKGKQKEGRKKEKEVIKWDNDAANTNLPVVSTFDFPCTGMPLSFPEKSEEGDVRGETAVRADGDEDSQEVLWKGLILPCDHPGSKHFAIGQKPADVISFDRGSMLTFEGSIGFAWWMPLVQNVGKLKATYGNRTVSNNRVAMWKLCGLSLGLYPLEDLAPELAGEIDKWLILAEKVLTGKENPHDLCRKLSHVLGMQDAICGGNVATVADFICYCVLRSTLPTFPNNVELWMKRVEVLESGGRVR